MAEKTLVVLKPDAVQRSIAGEIITTFEKAGLQLTRLEMRSASKDMLDRHYPSDEEWVSGLGKRTLGDYQNTGMDAMQDFGSTDPFVVGKVIKGWLVDFMASAPVIAMVWEGNEAVKNVRRICGATLPIMADPGSIRGKFSGDSPTIASIEKRPILNLIHASGNVEEARFEIELWFGKEAVGF